MPPERGRVQMRELICKGRSDIIRIYRNAGGYTLEFNVSGGVGLTIHYKTLKGAKIAMHRFLDGKYKDSKAPAIAWGD